MGLVKAGIGAIGGVLADQWKEFFTCDSLDNETLVVKGRKSVGSRSSNTKGHDNVISNGSGIVVNEGQCMIIVDNGKIVEFCAEAGEFTYDTSSEPSLFTGKLGESLKETFKTIGKRFTHGGDAGKDQRVYYFNTKNIMNNLFGTQTPIPFRVMIDQARGIDYDATIRCNGTYIFKISDPLLFYSAISGNVADEYRTEEITPQLKSDFLKALLPAFGKISELGIRYSAVPAHTAELYEAINAVLAPNWGAIKGLQLVDVSINSISMPKEDEDEIQQLKRTVIMTDPSMGASYQLTHNAEAQKIAAGNTAGAMTGFMGMGMAGGMMNNNQVQNLYQMGMQQQQMQQPQAPANGWKCSCGTVNQGNFCNNCGSKKPAPADSWTCTCGAVNQGNFCQSCGAKKPESVAGWTCSCGASNQGKFCQSCGSPKPAGAPVYKCDKCGWQPADPSQMPKFCPQCGDVFDENDAQ